MGSSWFQVRPGHCMRAGWTPSQDLTIYGGQTGCPVPRDDKTGLCKELEWQQGGFLERTRVNDPEPADHLPPNQWSDFLSPFSSSVNLPLEPSHSNPEMTLLTIPWAPHLAFSASTPSLPLKPQSLQACYVPHHREDTSQCLSGITALSGFLLTHLGSVPLLFLTQ